MLQTISNGIFGFVYEPPELAHHISEIVLDHIIWHMPLPKKHTVQLNAGNSVAKKNRMIGVILEAGLSYSSQ